MNIYFRPIYKIDINEIYRIKTQTNTFSKELNNIDFTDLKRKDVEIWFNNLKNEINTVRFSICLCKSNYLIGIITLGNINYNNKTCELHIYINSEFHGNGYGSCSIQKILLFCDKILGIKEINLKVFKNNKSAIHLYNKYGFKTYKEDDIYIYQKYTYK